MSEFHLSGGPPSVPPQLMIRANFPLNERNAETINDQVEEALRYGKPLILDSRFEVAQLIRGVWIPVFGREPLELGDQAAAAAPDPADGGAMDPRPG